MLLTTGTNVNKMASKKAFEDLDLSQEEIKRIENALKDEKFRKMFVEYAEEISNPENRKLYEQEIAMLEQEKGMDVQFVNPEPGHVLKTTIDGKKAFINICSSDKIGKPSSQPSVSNGVRGLHWQIPHSFSPPREDFDKEKKKCMVYDVVFHPDTLAMSRNPKFLKLVEDTATEGIARQFSVEVDSNNIKRPKMKYKGNPVATIIRSRKDEVNEDKKLPDANDPLKDMPYPYTDKTSAEIAKERAKEAEKKAKDKANKESKTKQNLVKKEENGFTVPKYIITHRSALDIQEFRNAPDARTSTRPTELVINIELPLCKSASGVNLDIFEDKLVLKSEKPAYNLDLKLSYPVDDENGSAKFDKNKKSLIVTLPVLPAETPKMPSFINGTDNALEKPLIEELPPAEPKVDQQDLPLDQVDKVEVAEKHEIIVETEKPKNTPIPVVYTLPTYDYNQDTETVTFIFHVRNVQDDSVCKSFSNPGCCEIKFISLGSGGFPMYYSFYIDFGVECKVVPEHSTMDISDKNMTLTLLKHKDCRSLWDRFTAGLDKNSQEERLFLTADTLQDRLEELQTEGENMGRMDETRPDSPNMGICVTEMNERKLTLKIRKPRVSFSEEEEEDDDQSEPETPTSAGIEVVHSKVTPNLQGILKPRSMSESSEDPSSSGDSPTCTSPRDNERRNVTFNNYVDKTTFKTNASVSSMKQALKSKRRRNRKKEEKKSTTSSRRRHNSNGSECSSCDEHDHRQSSESQSEEDMEHGPLANQLHEAGQKVEDCGVIEEDDEVSSGDVEDEIDDETESDNRINKEPGYQIHSEKKRASKVASEVKSKMAMRKTEAVVNDSDDDIEDNALRTKAEKSEQKSVKTRDENEQKVVDKTSVKAGVENGDGNDLSVVNGSSGDSGQSKRDTDGAINANDSDKGSSSSVKVCDGTGEGESVSESEKSDPGKSTKSGKNRRSRKKKNKGVKFDTGKGDNQETVDKGGNEGENKGENEDGKGGNNDKSEVGKIETELSWKEGSKTELYNPHRTQCAFDFSNAVMFDLDID